MKNLTFDLPCRKSTNDIGQNWQTMVKRRVLRADYSRKRLELPQSENLISEAYNTVDESLTNLL